jgi:hypothetical protein
MVVTCPNPQCKKRLTIDDALVGKRVSCRACKTVFNVTGQTSEVEAAPARREAPADVHLSDEDFDYPPRAGAQPSGPRPASTPPGPPRLPEKHGVHAAGNPSGGPPPLPTSPGVRRVPGGSRPLPPAPPTLVPPPPAPPAGAGNSINLVVNGLVRALSASKIGYFILGEIVLYVVMAVAIVLLVSVVRVTKNGGVLFLGLAAAGVLYVGLIGVLAGGMAHLADMDERGRKAGIGSAFGFCARKFVSLFMGAVSFAVMIGVVLAVVNGLAVLLNVAGDAGSFLAALLFLPQFAIDLILGVALAVWVVVPVAIAAENLTALQAIGRLGTCLCRDAKRLFVHFAISAAIGVAVVSILIVLFWLPVAMMFATNSPVPSMLKDGIESAMRSAFGSSGMESGPVLPRIGGPDLLRTFFGALVGLAVVGYLSAYWVGSFTGYYKDALRRGFRPPVPLPPPDGIIVTCPNPLCGKKLKVSVALAGKRVSCLSCTRPFTVPPLPPPLPGVAIEAASAS